MMNRTKKCIWSEQGTRDGVPFRYAQYMVHDDGGRASYYHAEDVRDCVTRAIVIAMEVDYRVVYDALFDLMRASKDKRTKGTSPRAGIQKKIYADFLQAQGWIWVPLMKIGTGCTTHLRGDELPGGRIICRLSRHLATMVDGILHDTYDSSRRGTRCVYGYWFKKGL